MSKINHNGKETSLRPALATPTATEGTEGGRLRPTGVPSVAEPPKTADPHVPVVKKRRNLTTAFKRKVVTNVNNLRSRGFGSIGAYLRTIGIYYSTAKIWERQFRDGVMGTRRGCKEQSRDWLLKENKRLRQELEQTRKRLRQSELLIELQIKISDVAICSLPGNFGRNR